MQLSVCYFKMILNDTWRLFISELCKTSRELHLEDISRLNMTSVAERLQSLMKEDATIDTFHK